MKQETDPMDYLYWTRVIDDLTNLIEGHTREMAVNKTFLESAKQERTKYPKPKPVKTEENPITR